LVGEIKTDNARLRLGIKLYRNRILQDHNFVKKGGTHKVAWHVKQ